MKPIQFQLRENQQYIQLNQLLQLTGLAQTGGHAKLLIQDMLIKVNGETETRVRNKIRAGDSIEFDGSKIVVS